MDSWEFHHQGEPSRERWSWRALNRDGSLHTSSRQQFDSFRKAFENAISHGFDQSSHRWLLARPTQDLAASGVDGCRPERV